MENAPETDVSGAFENGDEEMEYIDWEAFDEKYRSAAMYHYRARQFVKEGQAASVVFNVASVALENYLIALCELYGVDPGNHNFICLVDALDEVVDISSALSGKIRSLDFIYSICSLENFHIGTPEQKDADEVLDMCAQVASMFLPQYIEEARTRTTPL